MEQEKSNKECSKVSKRISLGHIVVEAIENSFKSDVKFLKSVYPDTVTGEYLCCMLPFLINNSDVLVIFNRLLGVREEMGVRAL